MNKSEFCKRIDEILLTVGREMNGIKLEPVNMWNVQEVPNVFAYAATCEHCVERQLEDLKGCERKTTFTADLSIGEWVSGWSGVFDTLRRCMVEWRDNVEFMSEFVLCVNWKAWEHHARQNFMWAKFYSLLYEGVRDLMYDYYEGDEDKTSYMWHYLD